MNAAIGSASSNLARNAAVEWLLGRINYERIEIPYSERQLKLDRMRQLLTRLGQPDAGMKIVHVAGTKGKGSTSAMIAGMLTAAGFRTGLFTSPHLERIEERFAVDGGPCSAEELVGLVERVRAVVEGMDGHVAESLRDSGSAVSEKLPHVGSAVSERLPYVDGPTFFEIVTAIALLDFVERQVDAAVLEVGLGGRLDSTNVCLPAVSVITSISFDHTKQLGNTLAAIAREKAGIIKPGVPVVSGVTDTEPRDVIAEVAREHGCRLIQLGRDFYFDYSAGDITFTTGLDGAGGCQPGTGGWGLGAGEMQIANVSNRTHSAIGPIPLAMPGRHQAANAAVALATVFELRRQRWCISTDAMREGLGRATLPGRVELINFPSPGPSPKGRGFSVVLDVAHNAASARALVEALAELPAASRRTLILSISSDKDVRAIVAELVPHFDRVVVTQYQENPRAIPADELADIVRQFGCGTRSVPTTSELIAVHLTPADAWEFARQTALPGELVCIAGSFFLAAEMRGLVAGTLRVP